MPETTTRPKPLTAFRATGLLLRDRYRRGLCLPTYTPAGWWECDVFEVTAAGYFREYEIKLSRADFRKDCAKRKWVWGVDRRLCAKTPETKHDLLAAGSSRGPSRFWYVTPAGLIVAGDLPPWAGLIELEPRRGDYWWPRERVKAPHLHREKCPAKIVQHARGICYYRMHDLLVARWASGQAPPDGVQTVWGRFDFAEDMHDA